jgi:hypothetical protein
VERKLHEIRAFENMARGKTFGAKRDQQEGGVKYITMSLKTLSGHQV